MAQTPFKITPQLEERINARWLMWHPWMLMVARRTPNVPATLVLGEARDLHRQRYIQILSQGLREEVLRRHALDDPRKNDEQFRADVENSMRYRRAQMGNQNGFKSKEQHATQS